MYSASLGPNCLILIGEIFIMYIANLFWGYFVTVFSSQVVNQERLTVVISEGSFRGVMSKSKQKEKSYFQPFEYIKENVAFM